MCKRYVFDVLNLTLPICSAQYAREYDDLMAREPSTEELDRRFLLGGLLHIGKMIGGGIAHLM